MKRAIAKIKLAPGNAGWFDPLTNIYLTLSKKECFVYNDQDITNIRQAVKDNKLVLKEGRLPSPAPEEKEVKKTTQKKHEDKVKEVEVKEEPVKVERPKKKTKRKPEESKLQKQEEEVKQEIAKQEDNVESPLVKVAELIKEEKAEDNNNG